MNLIAIFTRYPDQEACIEHLEKVRWGDDPVCPHCGGTHVNRKQENKLVGRWNCYECGSSFNVLSGTIFEKTKVPLQKWFFAIGLVLNAKKSLSSYQLARDLEMNQKTALFMQQRIRASMLEGQDELLQGVVEADETYVGGKPRKTKTKDKDMPNKRGRGTKKTPVIGAVERGGKVVAKVAENLTAKGILGFLKDNIDPQGTLLITDEYRAYDEASGLFQHATINHSECYADGDTHTNTIEGFWSLLKRAYYGSHHHYTKKWMPLYVAEACWKYNQRKNSNTFATFMQGCFA